MILTVAAETIITNVDQLAPASMRLACRPLLLCSGRSLLPFSLKRLTALDYLRGKLGQGYFSRICRLSASNCETALHQVRVKPHDLKLSCSDDVMDSRDTHTRHDFTQ